MIDPEHMDKLVARFDAIEQRAAELVRRNDRMTLLLEDIRRELLKLSRGLGVY